MIKRKLVTIKRYKRKTGIVKAHPRHIRALGKRIHYVPKGVFEVGYDEKGNFRGSKIVKKKKKNYGFIPSTKLDEMFYKGQIDTKDYLEQRL